MTLKSIKINDFGFRALMTFLIFSPLYYNAMQFRGLSATRLGHEQAFELGITLLFAITMLENLWLAVFLIWSVFIYAYYNFPAIGGRYVINIFMACILYQLTYKLVDRRKTVLIFKAVAFLVGLNALFIGLQKLGYDPMFVHNEFKTLNVDLVGIMGIKAVSGVFTAISLPIVMSLAWWAVLPMLAMLFLSECSSAVAASIAVLLCFVFKKSKKLFLITIIPLLIAGGLYIKHDAKANMMTDRVNLWHIATRDAISRPFVGMGLDSFRNIGSIKPFMYFKDTRNNACVPLKYDKEQNIWIPPKGTDTTPRADGVPIFNPWDNPHNEFVGLVYEFGVIGLLIFIALLWDISKRLKYCIDDKIIFTIGLSFLAYLICSIGQFPFHLARTAHISIVLLACFYKITDNEMNGMIRGA